MRHLTLFLSLFSFWIPSYGQTTVSSAFSTDRANFFKDEHKELMRKISVGAKRQVIELYERHMDEAAERHAETLVTRDVLLVEKAFRLYQQQHQTNLDTAKQLNMIKIGFTTREFMAWNERDTLYVRVDMAKTIGTSYINPDFSSLQLSKLNPAVDKHQALLANLMNLVATTTENNLNAAVNEVIQPYYLEKPGERVPIVIYRFTKGKSRRYNVKSHIFNHFVPEKAK